MRARRAYDELIRWTREESLLASCAELLDWDEETYLPPGGVAHRADQQALLAGMLHERGTDPRFGELLSAVEGSALVADPLSPEAVNVRELRRVYDRQVRLPRRLVEEGARVTSLAEAGWSAARKESSFARFRPWLEKVVRLTREEAECVGYESVPYDALLEDYEPGLCTENLTRLFDALRADLVPLLNALTHAGRQPDVSFLHSDYPLDRQRAFGESVARVVGFDFSSGRIDPSAHPFCTLIGPGDCRIGARYNLHDFGEGLFVILHEVGHALYDQGMPAEHHGTPMGGAPSVGLHEAQARLWENGVGRSRGFWEHFFPPARRAFPEALAGVSLDEFHRAVNRVEPSFLRAKADEVSYNLHVLVRFELEQALVSGELSAGDLPGAWDESYRRHLGIVPTNDAEGCLQDGHWASGLFGYFPTYTLGNVIAAQLMCACHAEVSELGSAFAQGDFGVLLGWLREKVHRQGGRYPTAALVERATGAPPDPRALVGALRRKYGELYGL